MTKLEEVCEDASVAILSVAEDEDEIDEAVAEIKEVCIRAFRAKRDKSWWEIHARPHFNGCLKRVRERLWW